MQKIFVSLMLSIVAWIAHAESFEQACRSKLVGPEIHSSSVPIELANEVDHPSAMSLTKAKWNEPQLDHLVIGMTWPEASLHVETSIDFIDEIKTGQVCYYPVITVVWNYKPMRISVPKEIPKGSCSYDIVMAHELEHVRIYREYVPKAAAATQAALRDKFGQELRYADSQGAAMTEVDKALKEFLVQIIPQAQKLIADANAAHDSPEESERVIKSCSGQTHAIVKSIIDAT